MRRTRSCRSSWRAAAARRLARSRTGYKTPDPIDLIYKPRGLGLHLASDLVTVAPQVLDSAATIKGDESPGGGGGLGAAEVLRSRFQSTAFFLGSVVTDAQGQAV